MDVHGIVLSDIGKCALRIHKTAHSTHFAAGPPRNRRVHLGVSKTDAGFIHSGPGRFRLGLRTEEGGASRIAFLLTHGIALIKPLDSHILAAGVLKLAFRRSQLSLSLFQSGLEGGRIYPEHRCTLLYSRPLLEKPFLKYPRDLRLHSRRPEPSGLPHER